MYSVYWIRHQTHTDIFSQGYVGISNNFARRMNGHKHKKENPHLKNAIDKHGWDSLIKEQILIADKDYCLTIETKLRPNKEIGWNISEGGGLPPITYARLGVKLTDEQRKKISDGKKGKTSNRKGVILTAEQKKRYSDLIRLNAWTCPHCNKIGHGIGAKNRWHFDNCKQKRNIL